MDFDIISNCSGLSNPSDETRSNVSTLSGLSTYQDEFVELRHLINPLKYPSPTFERSSTPKQDSGCELPYDDRISNLSYQLENSVKLNEKYKHDLYNLEKNIELKFHEKFEKLLKSNIKLKSELDNANSQIERLIRNFSTKQDTTQTSEKKIIKLEQKYHELSLQNSSLHFELLASRGQNEECEFQNKQLKIELNNLKIDIEAKKVCVKEMKVKISQQHLEIQALLKNSLTSTQSVNELSSELEHIKRIQEWYKEQLHLCQRDKKTLSDEVLKYKINSSSQNETIEILNLELTKCKNRCDIIQLEALKEKEKLWKQLESSSSLIISENYETESNSKENKTENTDSSIINYYETSIQDLTHEINKIKEYVEEQEKTIKKTVKENSKLMARCITLQKVMQQNEMSIEELENDKRHLNIELGLLNDELKKKSEELTSYKKEILDINAELKIRREEKELVENTIKKVGEQFLLFKSKYKGLEEELQDKNKQILQLQNEKQKLFMDNNWNICELEKMREKDTIINKLHKMVTECEQKISEHILHINKLQNEIQEKEDLIKNLQEEKQVIMNTNSVEIQKYEDVFSQYKIMVTNYENKVNDLQKHLNESKISVEDLKDNIKILNEELSRRDTDLSKMTSKCTNLENKLISYEKKISIKSSNDLDFYLNELISKNNLSLMEILQHAIKVYKVDNIYNKSYDFKLKETVDISPIFVMIEKYLQHSCNHKDTSISQENVNLIKTAIHRLQNEVVTIFINLNNKIEVLNEKVENSCKLLTILLKFRENENETEKVKELNVLLQVKELELKEKQKRYEINNRTLLRKVKEHLRGRNSAEKHHKYLQELYNSLSDEHNSLKLIVSSKDHEIENIKKQLQSYVTINDKLNQSVLSLEAKMTKIKTCDRCLDYTAVNKKVVILEEHIRELQDEKKHIHNILQSKEGIIVDLHQKTQEILLENSKLTDENNKHLNKFEEIVVEKQNLQNRICNLADELYDKKSLMEELRRTLSEEKKKYLESNNENIKLKVEINQLNDKMDYLSNEIQILNSTLQNKSEDLQQLEDQKIKIEINSMKKDQESQHTIMKLKNHLHDMQTEMNSLNGDKFFLQRLCSDLKLALKTYVGHNKVLKEKLNTLSKDKQDFNSLPSILMDIPTSSKYDDTYINKLLQQNKAPLEDKPLADIKGCLDVLRKEISALQEEIVKKNVHS